MQVRERALTHIAVGTSFDAVGTTDSAVREDALEIHFVYRRLNSFQPWQMVRVYCSLQHADVIHIIRIYLAQFYTG
jgi:hypothetical protein